MDEFKVNLSSTLMKGIATSLITKTIKKQLGCKFDITLNDLKVTVIDGKVNFHIDAEGEMNKEEFMKLVKTI